MIGCLVAEGLRSDTREPIVARSSVKSGYTDHCTRIERGHSGKPNRRPRAETVKTEDGEAQSRVVERYNRSLLRLARSQ